MGKNKDIHEHNCTNEDEHKHEGECGHEHHSHSHSHNHLHHHHHGDGNIGSAFLINALFTVIEFVGGLLTNSTAILSDCIHDLGDTISLGLSWFLEKKSNKGENNKFTYGYSRYSVLGSIINIIVLSIGTFLVLMNTIPRIIKPEPVNVKGMLLLAILGVAMNGLAVLKVKNGEKISERVVMLHLMEDVLGWLAVLVVGITLLFIDLPILDPILSLGISIYMIKNIITNTKIILDIILQTVPSNINLKEMTEMIKNLDENISDISNIKCWSLDGESNVITLHITLDNLDNFYAIRNKVEVLLKNKYNAKYTTISIN